MECKVQMIFLKRIKTRIERGNVEHSKVQDESVNFERDFVKGGKMTRLLIN